MNEFRTIGVYQKGSFPFPSDDINPDLKNSEWGRKFMEAMYAAYISDRTGVPYSKIEELQTLRLYAEGKQDVSKYQKILADESEEDGSLEGWMNINWDIFSVAPKFMNVVSGMFENQDHSIVATATDPLSKKEKDLKKLRKWYRSQYRDKLQEIEGKLGIPKKQEFLPETKEELELYAQSGGFTLAKETQMEEGLDYTFYISEWKEVKRKMIYDFASINTACIRDITDKYERKVKFEYVDPLNFIIQYSKHGDYKNAQYAGQVKKVLIKDIAKRLDISQDELKELAHSVNGKNGNPNIADWSDEYLETDHGYKYDDFHIEVLEAEWFSVNKEYHTYRTNQYGETFRYKEKWGKSYDTELKKTKESTYETIYKGVWIIGTPYVYDFGQQYDIVRKDKKAVELSYKFYRLEGRSLVDLMRPNLDQIQLTWLKLQNAIAMAAPPGISIEYSSLSNMSLGGKKMQPLDILSIRRGQGDLIWKATTHRNIPNIPGNTRPITELEGGIGRQLNEYIGIFETNLEFIRDLTGINRVADASTPNPEQSVGGSELAIAATNNALRPIYAGYIRLKEKICRSGIVRMQMLIKYDKKAYEGYMPAIGTAGTKIIQVGLDAIDVNYHIKIEAKPTEQRKVKIRDAATAAMQPDRDGFAALEYPDWLMIERLMEGGNLKLAEAILNHRMKVNKQMHQKIQERNMQLAEENAQKTAQVKGNQEREKENLKSQLKQQEIKLEKDLEERNAEKQHQRDKELKMLELGVKADTEMMNKAQTENTLN